MTFDCWSFATNWVEHVVIQIPMEYFLSLVFSLYFHKSTVIFKVPLKYECKRLFIWRELFCFLHESVCVLLCISWMCRRLVLRECSPRPNIFWWLHFSKKFISAVQGNSFVRSFENVLPDLKVRWGRQVRHVTNTSVRCSRSKTISKQKPFKRQNEIAEKKDFCQRSLSLIATTVKLVCSDHPRDRKKVVVVQRWSLLERSNGKF